MNFLTLTFQKIVLYLRINSSINSLYIIIIVSILFILYLVNIYYQTKVEHFKSLEESIISILDPSKDKKNKNKYYKIETPVISTEVEKIVIIDKPKEIKKEKRFIFIVPINNNKYLFYDKNKKNYLYLINDMNDHSYKIKIYNVKNNLVGKLLVNETHKFIFKLDCISVDNNINIEFYNNYEEAKVFVDNDDNYFYIKLLQNQSFNKYNHKRNKEYEIYVYSKKIGLIDYNGKVIVYEEYKKYLNLFGLTYILFDIVIYYT